MMERKMAVDVILLGYAVGLPVLIWVLLKFLRRCVRAKKCGHITCIYSIKIDGAIRAYEQRGILRAYGEKKHLIMKVVDMDPKYCLRCLAKKTVKCFRCGKPVFFDDLYSSCRISPSEGFQGMGVIDKKDGHLYAVCCMRLATGCASPNWPHEGPLAEGRWISKRPV